MELAAILILLAALAVAAFILREFVAAFALTPHDIRMLIVGGRTDAKLSRLRKDMGARDAFEMVYAEDADPWTSLDPRNRYQERKYRGILSFLPIGRHFVRALDLGCGLGILARRLADRADAVLGLDVAQPAIDRARARYGGISHLNFAQNDIFDLPAEMNGTFDLVMLADTLYYAPIVTDAAFRIIAARVADLLMPGGICVVVNHYFIWDEPTILSRRIFAAFRQAPELQFLAQHWRPFYHTMILAAAPSSISGRPGA
jgi:SAM-dependent methyltransferase